MTHSIKCGHCKDRHDSVAEVIVCSYKTNRAVVVRNESPVRHQNWFDVNGVNPDGTKRESRVAEVMTQRQSPSVPMITERQFGYIANLLESRPATSVTMGPGQMVRGGFDAAEKVITRAFASEIIDALLAVPKHLVEDSQSHPVLLVADGRYALGVRAGIRFYKVNTPTEGRWEGRTFVDVQAGEEMHPIRDAAARQIILEAIAADPKEAMLKYGREIGECGHCGRTLTNDESRSRGVGPVCAGRLGW